ncbi:hypothetical protein M9H77_17898 [Catharanthus roseus]|uniref:Uncharacterized protein n=1 Tax=Catharanthus roseus TaxID=4058 RepID=A0ACC0B5W6_CATRO|nr:hypothetical protein M9H77_17898 [Catharanthus roseus]
MLCGGMSALGRARRGLKLRLVSEQTCLAGIDYEMQELSSDDLVMGSGLCLWSPTVALHVLLNFSVEAALMCLDLLRLPSCAQNPHVGSSISVDKHYFKETTQAEIHMDSLSVRAHIFPHYVFVSVDSRWSEALLEPFLKFFFLLCRVNLLMVGGITSGIRASRFDTRFELLDFRQATRVNYLSLDVNHTVYCEPKLDPETIPKLEGVAPADAGGMGTFVAGSSPIAASPTPILPVESVSSFPALPSLLWDGVSEHDICSYCLWHEQRVEAASQQIVKLREKISQIDIFFYTARQACRQETTRTSMLEIELVQMRKAYAAPEREILELIDERDWLRRFLAHEAVSENSQKRQSKPIREATPRPEQATHKSFMEKLSKKSKPNYSLRSLMIYTILLRLSCNGHWLPLPPMGFWAVVEATTRTEMAGQAVIQRKAATGLAITPYKSPGQGLANLEIPRDPVASKEPEMEADKP